MVHKLTVYLIGYKTLDENLFTVLAEYIRSNEKLDSFCMFAVNKGDISHLRRRDKTTKKDSDDEKFEGTVKNKQHIFNLYQVLINKSNLIELRLILFMDQYNFAMVAYILKNNQQTLRKLQLRNALSRSMEPELDYIYKDYTMMPDPLKDEIYCFFNYLFALEDIEELRLTHFSFMSEINFMAVQALKSMRSTEIFSLDKNQGLVSSDTVMADSYDIAFLPIKQLNMGYTYFHCIRRWEIMMNRNTLTELVAGVLDFTSFASLLRFSRNSVLRKINLTLNKPCSAESIPVLFDIISTHAFKAKTLQILYVLNAFEYSEVEKDPIFKTHYEKLLDNMSANNSMRRLAFAKPGGGFMPLSEDYGFQTFKYIRASEFDSCAYLIKSFQRLFHDQLDPLELELITKYVIYYAFANYRKIVFEKQADS